VKLSLVLPGLEKNMLYLLWNLSGASGFAVLVTSADACRLCHTCLTTRDNVCMYVKQDVNRSVSLRGMNNSQFGMPL